MLGVYLGGYGIRGLVFIVTGWQKHCLRTAYYQIWPPLTYVEVKCHFTAEIVG